ncbi:MAG TPA: glycyl radical protein [Candidatus Aminicenantes bacterium]|mgnify:CR=1 FL=1|nr:glycyl radical protein [Candidatus Aminicenantes bacterium]
MNERIRRLRRQSQRTHPCISTERARLLTEFCADPMHAAMPAAVLRGSAFRHIMENKTLFLDKGELIVGERGPFPRATPTYPEICLHSLQDLDTLHSRPKVSFTVDSETRRVYEKQIIPFWKGRSLRERMFKELSSEWRHAYEAGVFTEFQEQRAPGHTAGGARIFEKGFLDILGEIRSNLEQLNFVTDPRALETRENLQGMEQAALGIIALGQRYADLLKKQAEKESDPARRQELQTMAVICSRVPEQAPRTFWEALQHYWFVHLGVITEFNTWDSFNPGRLDQHLLPFFRRDLAEKRLTPERARELLCAFWIKFNNQPAPPKVGVTAQESNTYTDFCLINLGGLTRDGKDGVNELTYMILDVIEEMRILQPSSMVQISCKNPDRFVRRALKIVATGFGQPSMFNTETIISELLRQGKSLEDAREGGASGCVESGAFGREAYFLTGYFNLPKILELTLHNGRDPRTGIQLGPRTGKAGDFSDFKQLIQAFSRQVAFFADLKIQGNNLIEQLYARNMPAPFLSLVIEDCVTRGRDYHSGGARYNTSYIQGVGLGSITDSLSAIRRHVFETGAVTLEELTCMLERDFEDHEHWRQRLRDQTPRWGNDDDAADGLATRVFEIFFAAVDGRPNSRGGVHRINLLPTTSHVYFGSITGATADGRRAGTPLSEGISPVQGADRNGPTAVLRSAARIDHQRTGGTLLNQKFSPDLMQNPESLEKVLYLVRAYFRLGGHHVQFNVVDANTLREAQREPEKHRDLIVRVAGYSDYFNNLGRDLQDEIIQRTEYQGF